MHWDRVWDQVLNELWKACGISACFYVGFYMTRSYRSEDPRKAKSWWGLLTIAVSVLGASFVIAAQPNNSISDRFMVWFLLVAIPAAIGSAFGFAAAREAPSATTTNDAKQ